MDADAIAAWRRARLRELIETKFAGNTTEAGRYLGYTGGAALRQMLTTSSSSARPITEKTIAKWAALPKVGDWFKHSGDDSTEPGGAAVNSDGTFRQAHGVSHPRSTVHPRMMRWEELMSGSLPREFMVTLQDESMAPALPSGTVVTLRTDLAGLQPNHGVLVADRDGNVFFRQYRFMRPGHWIAAPLGKGFEPLDSVVHGLQVLAVMVSRTIVGSNVL